MTPMASGATVEQAEWEERAGILFSPALASRGVDVETLAFEASHGRTALEYYDGFVFSFLADGMPPVASGGRYDALTAVLGSGAFIPAVGGVIRPGLVAGLKGAAA